MHNNETSAWCGEDALPPDQSWSTRGAITVEIERIQLYVVGQSAIHKNTATEPMHGSY